MTGTALRANDVAEPEEVPQISPASIPAHVLKRGTLG